MTYIFSILLITLFSSQITVIAKDLDPDLADVCLNSIKGEYIFSKNFSHSTVMRVDKNDSVVKFSFNFTPECYYDESHLTLSHKSKLLNSIEDEILRRSGYKMKEFSVTERVAMSNLPKPNPYFSSVVSVNLTPFPPRLNRICRRRTGSQTTQFGIAANRALQLPFPKRRFRHHICQNGTPVNCHPDFRWHHYSTVVS